MARSPNFLSLVLAAVCLTMGCEVKLPAGLGLKNQYPAEFGRFRPVATGAAVPLTDVSFVDASTGIAIGRGTVARTSDGGNTWQVSQPEVLKDQEITDLFLSSGTTGWAVGNRKLFHTTDGGVSWDVKTVENPALTVEDELIQVGFISPDTGFVSTGEQILMTTDGGARWTAQDPGSAGLNVQGSSAWAHGGNGIFKWVDGAGWVKLGPYRQRPVRVSETEAWVLTTKTTDGGKTWQDVPVKMANGSELRAGGSKGFAIVLDVADSRNIFYTSKGAFFHYSVDGGQTWDGDISPLYRCGTNEAEFDNTPLKSPLEPGGDLGGDANYGWRPHAQPGIVAKFWMPKWQFETPCAERRKML